MGPLQLQFLHITTGGWSRPGTHGPFDRQVVAKKLHRFDNTAPGDDGLTYQHWKRLDPTCSVLTEVLNICLLYERIPPAWKKATTILIFKKRQQGGHRQLETYLPVSDPLQGIHKLLGRPVDRVVDPSRSDQPLPERVPTRGWSLRTRAYT